MFVKPKRPELVVRDPVTGVPLPKEGKEVDDLDAYWLRRLGDGDVVKIDPKAAVEPAPAGQPKAGEEKK